MRIPRQKSAVNLKLKHLRNHHNARIVKIVVVRSVVVRVYSVKIVLVDVDVGVEQLIKHAVIVQLICVPNIGVDFKRSLKLH